MYSKGDTQRQINRKIASKSQSMPVKQATAKALDSARAGGAKIKGARPKGRG